MKIQNQIFFAGIIFFVLTSGCSKTVSKDGGVFRQIEMEPTPTVSPTPSPTPDPVGCDPNRFGNLSNYAVYTKEDLKLSRVAISRGVAASDAEITRSILGYKRAASAARADLQIVNDLDVRRVKIPKGRATYGKSLQSKKSSAYGGFEKTEFSMEENFHTISDFSDACVKAPANGTVIRTCVNIPKPQICTLRIKGSNSTLNIAEVTPEQLAGAHILRVDVPRGSKLVVNFPDVQKKTFQAMAVTFRKKSPRPDVYWNFPNAESLEFKATLFRGTVIAPEASVRVWGQMGKSAFWSRALSASRALF